MINNTQNKVFPFFVDTKYLCKHINSIYELEIFIKEYRTFAGAQMTTNQILKTIRNKCIGLFLDDDYTNFGDTHEHIGDKSLFDFLEENNVSIS